MLSIIRGEQPWAQVLKRREQPVSIMFWSTLEGVARSLDPECAGAA
jgi:hypothetical protein